MAEKAEIEDAGGAPQPPPRESTPLGFRDAVKSREDAPKPSPETPQRASRPHLGLSLNMPQPFSPKSGHAAARIPLSPKLDSSHSFGSPASVLPRRSRGLDFSRACTNLHHSTLAESSPDSSPVVSGRGIAIPQRRGTAGSTGMGMAGSPSSSHHQLHNCLTSAGSHAERTAISSSVGSVNMIDSDSSSTDDEDDDGSIHGFDRGDPGGITPQAKKSGLGLSAPFSPSLIPASSADWMSGFSAAKASLMNFQRARYRSSKKRHSSSSASGASPRLLATSRSPPAEKALDSVGGSSLSQSLAPRDIKSKLDELAHIPSDFHLSDGSDDVDGGKQAGVSSPSSGSLAGGSNSESGRRGVIRRPVTRRGNLLPKPKNFARIRATLFEECAPVESDTKKEAEVVRQVRENDASGAPQPQSILPNALEIKDSTPPSLVPEEAHQRPPTSFSRQVSRNSSGIDFWNAFDGRYRTPPPLSARDSTMASPGMEAGMLGRQPKDIDTEPESFAKINKRRRGDDFDLASFKRRAVSPGPSVHSSPVQGHVSAGSEANRVGHLSKAILFQGSHPAEPTANTSSPSGPVKRVGLQGMTETSDGFMKMTID
ncbi:TPA_exp: Uncharacterized protein A8136_3003 [Trichophyton benhamiae CBS 112371]|uniref:Uncharacterized protein n=1 Tax=Arthroderma benhamiae (strain ATCC MYA-4681 / CBS 112371) TaxID=663331 RepID=D4AM10_ARTBC|nr:uncharacterized protein ARB_05358 [Trichophyton benhamiae CBS 112371]EFE36419.1 hypothetical protein ARB_05358 [Trichophyton benhamiae CBS 112371]DAA79218.1 TPA_exp: Uncharacterized protein A8136_3003 [Trichophyton benhamiae CBS 112371]